MSTQEINRSAYPFDSRPKIFAMISAFLDESGIHQGADVCIIAGYFGGKGQWKKFEIMWRAALKRSGVPLEEFHAVDFVDHHGFFAFNKFPKTKHEQLTRELTEAIVGSRKITPVTVGVIVHDFNALTEPQRRFFTGANLRLDRKTGISKLVTSGCPSKPYFMPFLRCIGIVSGYAPSGGLAHFNFGLDRPFERYAVEMFKLVKEEQPFKPNLRRVGNAAFPMAKETPELQAADWLSHLTYKQMIEGNKSGALGLMDPTGTLADLLSNRRVLDDFLFFGGTHMQNALRSTYLEHGNWDGHEE